MILKTLHLQNFKQYKDLQLNFQEGLVGILGKNGAGKSSIFEAILLCFFGSTNTDKEFYKTSWAESKSKVALQLTFEVGTKEYVVIREFRGKALTHHATLHDHHQEQIATGAKPVTDEVSNIIGMDKDAFTRSIFSGQKELGILSNTKGEERKRMVRKMIGLDNLDAIQKLIRGDKNDLKKQISGQSDLLLPAEELKELQKTIKSTEKENKKSEQFVEKRHKALTKVKEEYQKAKTAFDTQLALSKEHNELNRSLDQFENAVRNLQEQEVQKKEEIAALKILQKNQKENAPAVKNFLKQKATLEQLAQQRKQFAKKKMLTEKKISYEKRIEEVKADIQKVEKKMKGKESLPKQLEKEQKELTAHKDKLENYQNALTKLRGEQAGIQSKINEREERFKKIQDLGKEAECPTCFQPLKDSYDQTLTHLQKEIEQYQKQTLQKIQDRLKKGEALEKTEKQAIEKAQQSVNQLQTNIQLLQQQNNQLQQQKEALQKGQELVKDIEEQINLLGKITFDESQYEQIENELKKFEPTYLQYQINEDKIIQIPTQEETLKQFQVRIKNGNEKIKEQKTLIKKLPFSDEKYLKAKTEQEKKENERDVAQEQLQEAQQTHQQLISSLKEHQQELNNHNRILETISGNQTEFDQLEELDGLFKAFKTYILDRIKPTITQHAGTLFERITKGRYESILVDDNFEFHIFENGQAYPITRFSGGEIDLANLCLRIGISKAIAELSGSTESLTFLGFDEIFGSQDTERREEIMLAFEVLKEQYRQIYIITHTELVKEYFSNILQIRKGDNGSEAQWIS